MSSKVPFFQFYNGHKMPMFGLGTYLSKEGEVVEAVKFAIDNGYRHIDTALLYENEKEVGEAIREKIAEGVVKREELFITTKLWNNCHEEKQVVPACKQSLKNLDLSYVDLYLIHTPMTYKAGDDLKPTDAEGNLILPDTDYLETWKGMEECHRLGLARSIGVSNFNSEQITRLMENSTIKPVNNQIEVNINLNQKRLIEFCKAKNISITAYSPLGRPGNRHGINNSLDNLKILEYAKKYGKTPEQIAFRFLLQEGAAPIPKSVTKSRIKENFDIFDFELTAEEMSVIEKIGTGERLCCFTEAKNSKYYPFNIPF